MTNARTIESVPQDIAYPICEALRRRPWYTMSGLWCWGCTTFTGGEPAQRCGAVVACPQVVARYRLEQSRANGAER
jgi:hypothetical protein